MEAPHETADDLLARQDGVARIDQLKAAGITRGRIRSALAAQRWTQRTATVITTFTGEPTPSQREWIAVLNGGQGAVLGGIAAANLHGLRHWERSELQVHVPRAGRRPSELDEVTYIRSRRAVGAFASKARGVPRLRIEYAVLLWASREINRGTVQGILTAVVQQRLTDPEKLQNALTDLAPLRHARLITEVLGFMEGGSQSKAEIDLMRVCRSFGIAAPQRQVKRRDASGRTRYTDAEWVTEAGLVVLEVDGGFHMDAEHWEEDLARERSLAAPGRLSLHCTQFELRDGGDAVAADLIRMGVPRVRSGRSAVA